LELKYNSMLSIKYTILLLVLVTAKFAIGQEDSAMVENPDSIFFEDRRNYVGVNVFPLFTSAFGSENKNTKINLTYKRNKGDKNLRVSLNYQTLANKTPYYSFKTIGSSDSSLTNRYFESNYKSYDVRFGFEELKGAGLSRFHIGADLILGYATFESEYRDAEIVVDSLGSYKLTDEVVPSYIGSHTSDFFVTGVDVSFGFDWFLDDVFLVTLQLTPQFNFYIANEERLIDQKNQYTPIQNFVDFNLGYVDIMLFYKF